MKRYINILQKNKVNIEAMSKELSRGVFWLVDGELLAYPFYEDTYLGVAKSGNTYNHKKLWKEISNGSKPYNYYPRGRVDISNTGKAIIYMNPNLNDELTISKIKVEFGIRGNDYKIYEDHSEHYKCYLDEGWKPDTSK